MIRKRQLLRLYCGCPSDCRDAVDIFVDDNSSGWSRKIDNGYQRAVGIFRFVFNICITNSNRQFQHSPSHDFLCRSNL